MIPPDLQHPVLLSVLGTGFATAFLHAALPTHWLPFVLVGRGQRWSLTRVLGAAAAAGLAHIVTTALAGALIVALGLALDQWISGLLPNLSATLLFLFSLYIHAWQGVRDIIIDYVYPSVIGKVLNVAVTLALIGYAAWSVQILWKL